MFSLSQMTRMVLALLLIYKGGEIRKITTLFQIERKIDYGCFKLKAKYVHFAVNCHRPAFLFLKTVEKSLCYFGSMYFCKRKNKKVCSYVLTQRHTHRITCKRGGNASGTFPPLYYFSTSLEKNGK